MKNEAQEQEVETSQRSVLSTLGNGVFGALCLFTPYAVVTNVLDDALNGETYDAACEAKKREIVSRFTELSKGRRGSVGGLLEVSKEYQEKGWHVHASLVQHDMRESNKSGTLEGQRPYSFQRDFSINSSQLVPDDERFDVTLTDQSPICALRLEHI